MPNVYLVAAKVAKDAVLTHHSALQAHGVAHSPLRTVLYFTSSTKMREFEVRGYRFHRVAGEAIVPVSTKERTLVDCLRDLRLAGGLEELPRSLGGFTSMSAERVAADARLLGSPTLVARAGWILEMFGERWRVDTSVLEEMRSSLGRGTYRLLPAAGRSQQEFVARWRLYGSSAPPMRRACAPCDRKWMSGFARLWARSGMLSRAQTTSMVVRPTV